MRIKSVQLIHIDVPFTNHTNAHMKFWLPLAHCPAVQDHHGRRHSRLGRNHSQLHLVQSSNRCRERIVKDGRDLLWDDALGAGVQMALLTPLARSWER